jgi:hypothetical protein
VRALPAAALCAVLAGCAAQPVLGPQWPATAPGSIELARTPFFPQADFQCGPAALATVLSASGHPTSPDTLVDEVYVPDRRGSLQPEIVAAARRRGLLVYPIRPSLEDLVRQLAAGEPVLVLQNLGIERLPVWHYAVVVGADAGAETLVLRSGTARRRVEPAKDFLRRWDLAGRWGVVTLGPGRLPANPDWAAFLKGAADLEDTGHPQVAAAAYEAALGVDPDLAAARFGLANVRYGEGRLGEAADLYGALAGEAAYAVPALNNLANLRADQGCLTAARTALAQARARSDLDGTYAAALDDTDRRLAALASDPADRDACP